MVVAVATVVAILIAVAGFLISQRMDTKAGQVKHLEIRNEQLLELLADIHTLACDSRATEPILADMIIDKINRDRSNRKAIR